MERMQNIYYLGTTPQGWDFLAVWIHNVFQRIGKICTEERNFSLRIRMEVYLKIGDLLKYVLSNSDF